MTTNYLPPQLPIPSHSSRFFENEVLTVVENHIPVPDDKINQTIKRLSERMNIKMNSIKILNDTTPYISQYYGEVRRELYSEFKTLIKDFSFSRKLKYKREFYQKIDLASSYDFQSEFSLRERYLKIILDKGFVNISKSNSESPINSDDEEFVLNLLKSDILELMLDRCLLIEKITDVLIRYQLYELDTTSKKNIIEQIHSKLISKYNKDKVKSWASWIQQKMQFPLEYIKDFKEKRNCLEYSSYTQHLGLDDLFVMINILTFETSISVYIKKAAITRSKEFLISVKAFLSVLVQNLDSLIQQFSIQMDSCFVSNCLSRLEKENKGFHQIIDQLVSIQDDLCFFDEKFLKETIQPAPSNN